MGHNIVFVARCLNFQQVKAKHQSPIGITQVMDVPMDFIVGLPRTWKKNYSVWVIQDRLTNYADVIPIKCTYSTEECAR